MSQKKKRAQSAAAKPVDLAALTAIVDRAMIGPLNDQERGQLRSAVDTLAFLTRELESKTTSIARLRKMLFGASTEKTELVLGDLASNDVKAEEGAAGDGSGQLDSKTETEKETEKEKPSGHGRNGASNYRGAKKIKVPHATLKSGAHCPECAKGKVYPLQEPSPLIRVTGMAPLNATVYECEQLRCNLCGDVFPAEPPEGVGPKKYDESAASMIALLKYGTGTPFNRIEKLQHNLGIPLPATTQWELVEKAADQLEPLHAELVRQAADGDVVHNDDTGAIVLDLTPESRLSVLGEDTEERTGTFTSGVVSTREGRPPIALYFTGPKHAGENIADVVKQRAATLAPPIQMCDASSSTSSVDFARILGACLTHGRRNFVECVDAFPAECEYVLKAFGEVYKNDAVARELSKEDRLLFHQTHSAPVMETFAGWMETQLTERKVEENSGLGQAIRYMQKHWARLTLFLHKAGAPLDNNICERALKKAILHRKNALFYKTLNGARVGDLFMSFIHSAELAKTQPFEYIVAALRHPNEVAADPARWMPWNYAASLNAGHSPSLPD